MIALLLAASVATAPHLFDVGRWHHPITSKNADAQKYFDHGLAWSYAFNRDEAIADFAEAFKRDPDCAICLWGEALNLGGDINFPPDPEREARAWKLIEQARALEPHASEAERAYIEALAVRYTPKQDAVTRGKAYAESMKALAKKLPDDADAQTHFAEAQMDLHPWDLWNKDGSLKPGTQEIIDAVQTVLKRWPQHVGANHLCIHSLEGTAHPEQALACAQRLPKTMPASGHLTHMPAHVYMRVGNFAAASQANEAAIKVDHAYDAKTQEHGQFAMMYSFHNYHFLWASSLMEGRSERALWAAGQLDQKAPDEMLRQMESAMPGVDFVRGARMIALVRFGKFKELAELPTPPADFKNATAYWHFARGIGLAHSGKIDEAKQQLAALKEFVAHVPKESMIGPTNSTADVFTVAAGILEGEIARADHQSDAAIAALQKAVAVEDTLGYDEPPDWPLPARQYLGGALLEANRPADAVAVYRKDLEQLPNNGWSLFGLWKALEAQKSPEAAKAKKAFTKAWARADVKLTGSSF